MRKIFPPAARQPNATAQRECDAKRKPKQFWILDPIFIVLTDRLRQRVSDGAIGQDSFELVFCLSSDFLPNHHHCFTAHFYSFPLAEGEGFAFSQRKIRCIAESPSKIKTDSSSHSSSE